MTGGSSPSLALRDRLAATILDGRYRDGDLLPSIRDLSTRFRLNPLTVAKVYHGLAQDGVVVLRQGLGTFVAAGGTERLRTAERARFLSEEWPPIRAHIRRLGLRPADLAAGISDQDERFPRRESDPRTS